MAGLKRIILIDTHLPGVVELKFDGHTNICGTNASGKTTLQRLIPVFMANTLVALYPPPETVLNVGIYLACLALLSTNTRAPKVICAKLY